MAGVMARMHYVRYQVLRFALGLTLPDSLTTSLVLFTEPQTCPILTVYLPLPLEEHYRSSGGHEHTRGWKG